MAVVTIGPDADTWLRMSFGYDAAVVELIKATVPGRCRRWVPGRQVWLVDTAAAAALLLTLRAHDHHVIDIRQDHDPYRAARRAVSG